MPWGRDLFALMTRCFIEEQRPFWWCSFIWWQRFPWGSLALHTSQEPGKVTGTERLLNPPDPLT